jgi:hypothetical protein
MISWIEHASMSDCEWLRMTLAANFVAFACANEFSFSDESNDEE